MKKTKVLLAAVLSLSLAATLSVLTACQGAGNQVAATVNGTELLEEDVTNAIEAMRSQSEEYSDDAAWAQALATNGLTPESLRESVIEDKIQNIVLSQEAEAQGFTVDEASVDEQVAQTKETLGADEETWLTTLQQYGYKDEQAYRDMLAINDLTNQLYENYSTTPTDEQLITFIAQNPTAVEGYTVPGADVSSETSDTSTDETTDASSTDTSDTTDSATTGTEATDATDATDVTDTTDTAGTEETAAIPESDVDLSAIPEDVLAQYEELWLESNKSTAFSEWLAELVDNADVVINDMPSDVPYNVDMSLADSSSESESDESTKDAAYWSSSEGIEEAKTEGLEIVDDVTGEGEEASAGSTVSVYYTGSLEDGTVFDSQTEDNGDEPYEVTIGSSSVINGWHAGLVGMKVGGTRTLTIPASLAYGDTDHGDIPAGSTLTFTIELVEISSSAG